MALRARKRKDGTTAWLVRGDGPARTFDVKEDAERYELELKRRKQLGSLYEAPPEPFGKYLDGLMAQKKLTLRPRSYQRKLTVSKHLKPLRSFLVPTLRAGEVDRVRFTLARTPRTANMALNLVHEVLRFAQMDGQSVEPTIFHLKPIRYDEREVVTLDREQLYEFASFFPDHVKRLILVAGLTGMRQGELFDLLDSDLSLDKMRVVSRGTLSEGGEEYPSPAGHALPLQAVSGLVKAGKTDAKSTAKIRTSSSSPSSESVSQVPAPELRVRKGKTKASARVVHLSPEIAKILKEQLIQRARGTERVFPNLHGNRWSKDNLMHQHFRPLAKSRYPGLTFHALRHSAISIMAQAGWKAEYIASQVGHKDGGALIHKRYRHLFTDEVAKQAARFDEDLGIEAGRGT